MAAKKAEYCNSVRESPISLICGLCFFLVCASITRPIGQNTVNIPGIFLGFMVFVVSLYVTQSYAKRITHYLFIHRLKIFQEN